MSPEAIEVMCQAARQRIAQHINRCAGQHLRAMKKQAALRLQQKTEKENHE